MNPNNVFYVISVTDCNGNNAWLNLSGAHDSMPLQQVETAPIEWVSKFALGFMFSDESTARNIWQQAHSYLSSVQANYNKNTSSSLLIRQFGVNVVMGHLVRYEVDSNGFCIGAHLIDFIDITQTKLV
jgi:hypothetical protein